MGPVHVDALRLQALQTVPDGLVDGLPAETFHGARKAVGAGRLRTDLGADFHLVAHAAISEPLADDGLALAPEAGLGSPEGVAVRGVDPLAAQIQVGVEDFTGLGGRQAGSEVHGAQRHAGVCVSHRVPLLRVIAVSAARRASDRNRICTHRQELQRRHEYASPVKKMVICGRPCRRPQLCVLGEASCCWRTPEEPEPPFCLPSPEPEPDCWPPLEPEPLEASPLGVVRPAPPEPPPGPPWPFCPFWPPGPPPGICPPGPP